MMISASSPSCIYIITGMRGSLHPLLALICLCLPSSTWSFHLSSNTKLAKEGCVKRSDAGNLGIASPSLRSPLIDAPILWRQRSVKGLLSAVEEKGDDVITELSQIDRTGELC